MPCFFTTGAAYGHLPNGRQAHGGALRRGSCGHILSKAKVTALLFESGGQWYVYKLDQGGGSLRVSNRDSQHSQISESQGRHRRSYRRLSTLCICVLPCHSLRAASSNRSVYKAQSCKYPSLYPIHRGSAWRPYLADTCSSPYLCWPSIHTLPRAATLDYVPGSLSGNLYYDLLLAP